MSGSDGNPRKDVRWAHIRSHLLESIATQNARGLEIGAFDLPIIDSADGHCDYADFFTTEELKAQAGRITGHNPDFVVAVKFDLKGGYDVLPINYDWIAASHVIEHIPDVMGWFGTLGRHIRPGGVLFLGVPDKRYIFDYHRDPTTFTQMMARHDAKLTKPSFEQIFDHRYWTADVSAHAAWTGAELPPPGRYLDWARGDGARGATEYVDSHCSVFTPDSFRALMHELTTMKLVPFTLRELRDTPIGHIEFTAVLDRT